MSDVLIEMGDGRSFTRQQILTASLDLLNSTRDETDNNRSCGETLMRRWIGDQDPKERLVDLVSIWLHLSDAVVRCLGTDGIHNILDAIAKDAAVPIEDHSTESPTKE